MIGLSSMFFLLCRTSVGVQGVLIVFFGYDVGVYCHDVIEEVFHCFYQDCSGGDFLSDHL